MSRQGLEALYKAGGRRFLVWGMVATDCVPVVTLLNGYLNQVPIDIRKFPANFLQRQLLSI